MAVSGLSDQEISRRANEIYRGIRAVIETQNIGRYVSIDALTGAYRIDDTHLGAVDSLEHDVPGAEIFTKRIGYDAAVLMGGSWHREKESHS